MIKASDLPITFGLIFPEELIQYQTPSHLGYKEFYVPTQLLITEPQLCVPKKGRYWELDLLRHGEVYLPFIEYIKIRESPFTPMTERAYVTEIWQNKGKGDDVDFQHEGYAIVGSFDELVSREYRPWLEETYFRKENGLPPF